MRNVFDDFKHLWPESRHQTLAPILKSVCYLRLPSEDVQLVQRLRPETTVIVSDEPKLINLTAMASMGFEHIIQASRPDFAQELLVAALMISRPLAFQQNPMPFLLAPPASATSLELFENHLKVPIRASTEKLGALDQLQTFLAQTSRMDAISDLCLQTADELITNALFGAPTDNHGAPLFLKRPRTSNVVLPFNASVNLFAHTNGDRLIIGAQDSFGSLHKDLILKRLNELYSNPKAPPLYSGLGAGLGFKFMIDNSANFYVHSQARKSTFVAAGFILSGQRANLTASKHFHFSTVA